MPNTVNEQVVDDITATNMKIIGGAAATGLAAVYANYASHIRFMDGLREKLYADVIGDKSSVSDAVAKSQLLKGAAESSSLGDLSQLAAGQEAAKVANTTPPETGIAQQLANLAATVATMQEVLRSLTPAK